MLPQCTLNPEPQPFGSEALLSEPLRHVLLERAKIFIWSCSIGSNQIIQVQECSISATKDKLRISQVAYALIAHRGEH